MIPYQGEDYSTIIYSNWLSECQFSGEPSQHENGRCSIQKPREHVHYWAMIRACHHYMTAFQRHRID